MVFNRSMVIPARFSAVRRQTGGHVGGLYLSSSGAVPGSELPGGLWQVMLESRGTLRAGEWVDIQGDSALELLESQGAGMWLARLVGRADTLDLLHRVGSTPLPPYIRKARRAMGQAEDQADDRQRYNTVYAAEPGSVAAPTAGLHFTPELLAALDAMGVRRAFVTLHVGLGTFAPVRTQRVEDHPIHSEPVTIPAETIAMLRHARAHGARIIPVGTTTVRAMESLPDPLPDAGVDFTTNTNLFITPDGSGFHFRFADALMTNFHLPCSTLLALVAALPHVGIDRLKQWYRTAIEQQYRFYSYGDAMFIV